MLLFIIPISFAFCGKISHKIRCAGHLKYFFKGTDIKEVTEIIKNV